MVIVLSMVGPDAGWDRLSSTQRTIARLVNQALTNRQIARHLSIAERTVEGHLERIRTKLGVHSRTAIAVWMVESGA